MSVLRAFVLVLAGSTSVLAQAPSFDAPLNYSVPSGAVAVGDFNNDAAPDIATGTQHIVLLIGDGDGTFQPPVEVEPGTTFVAAMVAGDFNADANLDLASVRFTSPGSVSVRMGNGDGTFQTAASYAVGSNPVGFVAADVTGDNVLDLVTVDSASGTVSLLAGRSNGTFAAAVAFAAGAVPRGLIAGDFNEDSAIDLAVWSSESVSTLLADGSGGFHPPAPLTAPAGAVLGGAGAAADFDNDGHLDLPVVACHSCTIRQTKSIHLYRGTGDGSFPDSSEILLVGENTRPVMAVADFDGDGESDIAVLKLFDLHMLLGNGDGTFTTAPDSRPLASRGSRLTPADFNGDSRLDLAIGMPDFAMLGIRMGQGDGTFHVAKVVAPDVGLDDAVAGDFNGDGHTDLAAISYLRLLDEYRLTILLGNGNGTFQPPLHHPAPGREFGAFLAGADLNGDAVLDLLVLQRRADVEDADVGVFLGKGDGTFEEGAAFTPGEVPESAAIADFDGDSIVDLVVANGGFGTFLTPGSLVLLIGRGDATFEDGVPLGGVRHPLSVVSTDLNGDGAPDLAVTSRSTRTAGFVGAISIMLNNGDGSFQTSYLPTPHPWQPFYLAAGDLNGDGLSDLLVTLHERAGVCPCSPDLVLTLLGNGDGTFQFPGFVPADRFGSAPAIADVNGDSRPDLVMGQSNRTFSVSSVARVFTGNGDGTFAAAALYQVQAGAGSGAAVAGDFDGDGRLDLVVGNKLLTNTTTPVITSAQ